jgi:uncharacterized membrane protein
MRTRYLKVKHSERLSSFPNFSSTGSIFGMKKLFYGKNALLVRSGSFIYNVSSRPEIYYAAK